VEQFLRSIPEIKEVAVYPVASAHGEDEIAATIVVVTPDIDLEQQIRNRCREELLVIWCRSISSSARRAP